MCLWPWVCQCAHLYMCVCGSQRVTSLPPPLPTLYLRWSLSLKLQLTVSTRLAGQRAPEICLSLHFSKVQGCKQTTALESYIGLGSLTSVRYALYPQSRLPSPRLSSPQTESLLVSYHNCSCIIELFYCYQSICFMLPFYYSCRVELCGPLQC